MISLNNKCITEQDVDCIVNAWNRNFIPYWLLVPQGVSKAIRKKSGNKPFKEVFKFGLLSSGDAVITSAGKLKYKAIIHVAGINAFWFSTDKIIIDSINNAITLAINEGLSSIAIPLIGAGTGGKSKNKTKNLIIKEANKYKDKIKIIISEFG